MRLNDSRLLVLAALVASVVLWTACNKTNDETAVSSSGGKIPVTTKSEDARQEFLQGRDLADKLLAQDAVQHFDRAIALDPDFASAELARANTSPTAKEFLEHLNKAVALADKASQGEKLLILANEAASNADVPKQKEYLEQAVAAYPNDERAQFALGGFYFGQQDLGPAVEHNKKATELAPNYSGAYNILGYLYRQQGDYANAELAFRKYIDLIPGDPNPYDSYAELLLKMGRFDESMAQYRKALSIDPKFFASHFGISADLMYQGKHSEAEAELQKMVDQGLNDGEVRLAYFGLAVVAADNGKLDKAAQQMDKEFAVAEKKNDAAAMAADLQAKGNIVAAMQKYDDAKQIYERSVQILQSSNVSQEIKDNAALVHHFNLANVAAGKRDFVTAKAEAEEFRKGAEASKNAFQIRQAHEVAGVIALAQKDYDTAIAELGQANQQNPQDLYRLSLAYSAKGDSAKAREFCKNAAEFNSLPQLPYAFIRAKAVKAVGKKG